MAIRKKGAPPTQTTHVVNEQAAILEREKKALHLKKAGASYRAIGEQLSVSHTQARHDVEQALTYIRDDVGVDAKALRDLEVARLDDDLLKLQDYINGERVIVRDASGNPMVNAVDGSLIYDVKRYAPTTVMAAIDRKIRIQERRSKLLGLDAPVKFQELTWRDQAIAGIKAGELSYQAVAAAFDESLAVTLFREAGVTINKE